MSVNWTRAGPTGTMAVATQPTAPDGLGHAILTPDPAPVPLVFAPGVRSRPPFRAAAGVAFGRGHPRPRPPDRDELDPGRRAERRVPPVLHHGRGRRPAGGFHRRPVGAWGGQAGGGRCG